MPRTQSPPRQPQGEGTSRAVTITERREQVMREVTTMVAKRQEQLESLLAGQIDTERFVTVALQAVQGQPELLDATPLSIMTAIREAATWGVEIGGAVADASLVKYGDEAQLSLNYRGLRRLGLRDRQVAAIDAQTVYERDDFRIILGDQPQIHHVPTLDVDRGNVCGCYGYARFKNGELVVLWMPIAEILQRRDVSRSWQRSGATSIWGKWPREQEKKTVLKRLITEKLPLTPVVREALERDTEADLARPVAGSDRTVPIAGADAKARLLDRMGLLPAGESNGGAPQQPASGTPPRPETADGAVASDGEPSQGSGEAAVVAASPDLVAEARQAFGDDVKPDPVPGDVQAGLDLLKEKD